MAVVYRQLKPDEEDALLDMVAAAMGDDRVERQRVFHDFADDPQRFARTHVAVSDDGSVLSAASYWVRHVRDADGQPLRVGHIFGVATRSEARGHGYAGRLLEATIGAMRQEGCTWSALFTREQARPLYARYGWRDRPLRYQSGSLGNDMSTMSLPYTVRRYDPRYEPAGWERLATVYAAYNVARPLTVVRDLAYWRGYAAWMFSDWLTHDQTVFFVATRGAEAHDLCGYVLVHFYDAAYARRQWGSPPWLFVSELGMCPGDEDALLALFSAVVDVAAQAGMGWGQGSFPHEPQVDRVVQYLFGATRREDLTQGSMMARPITPHFTEDHLEAIFAAPAAISWDCDHY
jgi:GNAT superfamily N-acetyltransferase